MYDTEFRLIVQRLLGKYDGTPLQARWQEAISFGAGIAASDYWIRDSDNVVNIVWLNSDGIRDVAMVIMPVPSEQLWDADDEDEEEYHDEGEDDDDDGDYQDLIEYREAMFNFVPLKSIASFEVREGNGIARQYGLAVSGDKLVNVILNTSVGHLYWVANSGDEIEHLDRFFQSVLTAYLHTR